MKPFTLLAASIAMAGLIWLVWPDAPAPAVAIGALSTVPTSAVPPRVTTAASSAKTGLPGPGDGIERVPNLTVDQSQSATASLADAHLRGDPRTPPIVRTDETGFAASDADKADPKAYAAYEARQHVRVYAQFHQAAQQMLPQLRADIERGRQLGIAPDKIAKAEEKYRRIAEEQAAILKKYPELAGPTPR